MDVEDADRSTPSDFDTPVTSEAQVDATSPVRPATEEGSYDDTPSVSLLTEISNLTDRNQHLTNLNAALEAEILEVRAYLFQNNFVHEELLKSHGMMTKETERLQQQVIKLQEQVRELTEEVQEFRPPKAKKKFHELGPSQQTKVKRDLKDTLAPAADHYVGNRDLKLKQLIFEHADGTEKDVIVNAIGHRTYANLTEVGKTFVADMADAKVLGRISDVSYANFRAICSDLPPLLQVKQYEADVSLTLPPLEPAPDRSGAFCSLRDEVRALIEHLITMGLLTQGDHVWVKGGIDATKYSNRSSATIYSVAAITAKGNRIAAVGACLGGDGYEDVKKSGQPFFNQLHELAKSPFIQSTIGLIHVDIRQGGDWSNCAEIYGLSKPTCHHPCICCTLPKAQFELVSSHESVLDACNSTNSEEGGLARTRGNIIDQTKQSVRKFGVKNFPVTSLPLDPNRSLATFILICTLHLVMRISGKHVTFFGII